MSVQNALHFIKKLGEDEGLKTKIRAIGADADLEFMVSIGAETGLDFTVEELRVAFTRDWSMRRYFYCGDAAE